MEAKGNVGATGLVASLLPVAAGLAASAMLAVDYLRPAPVFCAEDSGCAALKRTVFAMPMGVPTPLLGLVGFAALGAAAPLGGRRARAAQLGMAAVAGLAGVLFVVLQVLLGHLCPYCLVADTSGLASLVIAAWRLRSEPESAGPSLRFRLVGGGTLAAAAALPLATGFRADVTPAVIRAEIARAPRGEVTIVDFVDFECPFCRMTHAELSPVLESHRGRIHLVRRQVPLRMHPHAQDAARAACCAAQLGQGDAMADALFGADVDTLTPEGCEKIAEGLGLPLDAYRECVKSPATDASIQADKDEFKAARGYALPTIWIDDTLLVGAQPRERLAEALHAALARAGS